MIVGNGLIGTVFRNNDKKNTVFFASGVSNSLEKNNTNFQREEVLLRKTIQENSNKLLVYFSTCSVYDSSKNQSAYVQHKLRMENMVEKLAPFYLVLRASNAVGNGGNPNLLLNYVMHNIRHNIPIKLHTQASRNLIDVEDLKNITLQLLRDEYQNTVINVASPHHYTMNEIITNAELLLHAKAMVNCVEKGQQYIIDIPEVKPYFVKNNKTDKMSYLTQLMRKYYL